MRRLERSLTLEHDHDENEDSTIEPPTTRSARKNSSASDGKYERPGDIGGMASTSEVGDAVAAEAAA